VSCHHWRDVRRGMKWSRVRWEKGWPISDTGRKSQPLLLARTYGVYKGKLRHSSGCFHGKARELSIAPM
jgi:hypothetical protein